MNSLIKTQIHFLRLLLSTSTKQQMALIKTIQPSQMKAIVQIAYNVLHGYRLLSNKNKKTLQTHKLVIRRFISKGLSYEKRRSLLVKYLKHILLLLQVVRTEI